MLGSDASGNVPSDADQYVCVVEENIADPSLAWRVAHVSPAYADRQAARAAVYEVARDYRPSNPSIESWRRIIRIDDDNYIVEVQGAMTKWHFRVSVGQLVEKVLRRRDEDF